ncbi:MAG: HD-GYP domain-containing protein [Vicinamibacterales bacterium]
MLTAVAQFARRRVDASDAALLERLAAAATEPDDPSRQHPWRVGALAARIARALRLSDVDAGLIGGAARFHDIGKIAVPAHVLGKRGALDDLERRLVERHTIIGHQILSSRRSPLLQLASQIALRHHERWDGRGYPHGLGGERIPLPARIAAVADAWDALTHERPYRPACTEDEALIEVGSHAGGQFDPQVVDALVEVLAISADDAVTSCLRQVTPIS